MMDCEGGGDGNNDGESKKQEKGKAKVCAGDAPGEE